MKKLFNTQPDPEKKVDFGDSPIFNMGVSCKVCVLKDECSHKSNTLNCYITLKRYKRDTKSKAGKEVRKERVIENAKYDREMKKEQDKVIKELQKEWGEEE